MLKIKEDKMQDLEKLGFKKCKCSDEYIYFYHLYKDYGLSITIEIAEDRTIILDVLDVNGIDIWTDELNILYELFANDMIEKVVEDEDIHS